MVFADLHTHTTFSDGRLSPAGLVEKAALRGLGALAITDHDSVGGYGIAALAARQYGIELIAGVELSGHLDDREVHVLGYAFDPTASGLRRHLAAYRESRVERAREMVRRLEALSVSVAWERVRAIAGVGAIGRPHVARAIIEAGHVATMGEAFERFLGDDAPAFVPKPHVPVESLIEVVHVAGGVAVLAHPATTVSASDVSWLVDAGLDGIETIHPSHDAELSAHWERVASRLGVVRTGGSDYHGYRLHEEAHFGQLGVSKGDLSILLDRSRPVESEAESGSDAGA